ncbi:MAG: glycosyltransferase family 2 protein [Candidatus Kerfeldbacteria bacterium]|nr:glycosyltransferase family 2 protein [Candidatus Kerfeldbacteria bacterium]
MKYSLVILTYNEIDGVTALLDKIPYQAVDEVFVVDGGSTDGTIELFKRHTIRVIEQQSRKGRGEAFRIAAEHATGDVMIVFSPDGNEDPNDIPKFKHYMETTGADVVIASRMMPGAHNEEDNSWWRIRKWANNVFNWLANICFNRSGTYVTDSINGFRAIKLDLFKRLQQDAVGYTIEYQMTMRCFKAKKKIVEFPTYESARIGGESYAKSIPTGIAFLKCLWHELVG